MKSSVVILFSSSAIIKIIFGNVEFSRNYLFEMSKFKKIAMNGKLQKKTLVESRRLLLQANPLVKKDVLKRALVLW
jgi:hypothetical protein